MCCDLGWINYIRFYPPVFEQIHIWQRFALMLWLVQAAGCWDDSRRISRSSGSGVTTSSKGNSVRGSQEELLVLAGVRAQAGLIITLALFGLNRGWNCQKCKYLGAKTTFATWNILKKIYGDFGKFLFSQFKTSPWTWRYFGVILSPASKERSAWSNVSGHAAASTALTTNWHGLMLLPLSVLRHGGLAFLVLYSGLLIVVGVPLVQYFLLSCRALVQWTQSLIQSNPLSENVYSFLLCCYIWLIIVIVIGFCEHSEHS